MNARIRLFASLLLVGVVLLAAVGCGGTPTPLPTATPLPPTATPVPPTDTPVPPTDTPVPTDTPAPTDTPPPTATPEPTEEPEPEVEMETYRNEAWGVAIEYPAHWIVEEDGDQVILGSESEVTMLLVSAMPGDMPISPDALLGLVTDFMGEGITVDSEGLVTRSIGGHEAAIAPLLIDQDGLELQGNVALVSGGDAEYTYLFVGISLSAFWEQQAPILEKMVDSVEFFSPTAAPPPPPEPTAEQATGGVVDDLELINISDYVDAGGTLHFVGEVQNNGDVPVESVDVAVVLFDDGGEQLAVEEWSIPMNYIPAGEVSPFEVLFLDPPKNADTWEAYVAAEEADFMLDYTYADLVFVEHDAREPDFGDLELFGVVENVGESDAKFVQVTATVYDAEGTVVAVDYIFVDADVLKAGETSPFSLTFLGMGGEPDSYVLLVQGAYLD